MNIDQLLAPGLGPSSSLTPSEVSNGSVDESTMGEQASVNSISSDLNKYKKIWEEEVNNLTPRRHYNERRNDIQNLTLNLIMTLDSEQIETMREEFDRHTNGEVNLPVSRAAGV